MNARERTRSNPLFDARCEACCTQPYTEWVQCEQYDWKHPDSGAVIQRRGMAVCCDCAQERKELR